METVKGPCKHLVTGSSFDPVRIEALKHELQALPVAERRKLMAFMVVLEDRERAGYAAELARRLDDPSPDHWLTPEQCEREPGLPDST